jgi:hypothetical protein
LFAALTSGDARVLKFDAAFVADVFGKMLDKDGPGTSLRRQEEEEEEEVGGKSQASSFSDAFGWANFQFGDIFVFAESSCAFAFLSDFWATVGTFMSSLLGAFALRYLIVILVKKIARSVTGMRPPGRNRPIQRLPVGIAQPSACLPIRPV